MRLNIFKLLIIILLFVNNNAQSQSNWTFVGPVSENVTTQNKFETGQMGFIEIDPNDPNHLFSAGRFAGLWESFDDGANWESIETTPFTETSGVSGMTFLNSNEIIFGNAYMLNGLPDTDPSKHWKRRDYTSAIFKYNFNTNTFTNCGSLPTSLKFIVNSIYILPQNNSVIFVSTSIGLFRSTNSGVSWSQLTFDYTENVETVVVDNSYYIFASGSYGTGIYGPTGNNFLKVSVDFGDNFSDLTSNLLFPTLPAGQTYTGYGLTRICKSEGVNESKIFLYTIKGYQSGTSNFEIAFLNTISINLFNGNLSYTNNLLSILCSGGSWARMALEYDSMNNGLWFGGVQLSYYDLDLNNGNCSVRTNAPHTENGYVHSDIHDITIKNNKIYVACDGGIGKAQNLIITDIVNQSTYPYFNRINNDLNVSIINGFSGTDSDKDIYAAEYQDIINLDVFSSTLNSYSHLNTNQVWESDGPLIDKFNKDYIIADQTSYGPGYVTSNNGGQTISSVKSYYFPISGSSIFEKSSNNVTSGEMNFSSRNFYQDPYRPERIFKVKNASGIYQYIKDQNNDNNSAFVLRFWTLGLEPTPGAFGIHGWNPPTGISFSPETINSLHIAYNGLEPEGPGLPISRPTILKYIGQNIEDCWHDHNANKYTISGVEYPQWASITPASMWASFNVTELEQSKTLINSIETSPWNKDVVYISVFVPNHPELKVLKYDGTNWSNISGNLPQDIVIYSMILDRQSNDGLYICTQNKVYYKSAFNSLWSDFSTNYPGVRSVQIEVNYDENTLRAGTYGRGIWKSNLMCPTSSYSVSNCSNCNSTTPNNFWEGTNISVNSTSLTSTKRILRASEYIEFLPGATATTLLPNSSNVYFFGYIHGCNPSLLNSFKSSNISSFEDEDELSSLFSDEKDIDLYPNPTSGIFKMDIGNEEYYNIEIYDGLGKKIKEYNNKIIREFEVDISNEKNGVYYIRCFNNGDVKSNIIIKN